MIVKSPQSKEDFIRYYNLRWKILRKPWNQPEGSEKDEFEDTGFHVMVCENNGTPLGTGRLHFNTEDEAQIRYMAVEDKHRGRGIGKIILERLEEIARNEGAHHIVLNARENAVTFYKLSGYTIIEPAHTLFDCIHHVKMIKDIDTRGDLIDNR